MPKKSATKKSVVKSRSTKNHIKKRSKVTSKSFTKGNTKIRRFDGSMEFSKRQTSRSFFKGIGDLFNSRIFLVAIAIVVIMFLTYLVIISTNFSEVFDVSDEEKLEEITVTGKVIDFVSVNAFTGYVIEDMLNNPAVEDVFGEDADIYRAIDSIFKVLRPPQ